MLLALTKLSSTCIENTSRLRIGTTNALNFGNIRHLGGAIERLKGADITDLQNLNSGQLSQSLQKGLLDIVIIGEKSVHTGENIAFHWLYKEPLKLVMPASHPAAKRSRVSLTEVCKLPLFWFSRAANPNLYDKCENLFDKLPCTFKRIKEPDDSMTMLSYISKGKAIALMPYSMCTFEHKDLVYKQLNDQQSRHLNIDVYAATRKSDTRPMVLEAIQQLQLP
ncbi:LysR family substrate-binding domain-containing protein [Vibrio bivalvicida]|uniref:LysR family substrate-binding domain-containing protein n=1 Tax=Vibrio bivalvicida TaxID=1276888 RepID=A0ABV4MLB8_9VIBR